MSLVLDGGVVDGPPMVRHHADQTIRLPVFGMVALVTDTQPGASVLCGPLHL